MVEVAVRVVDGTAVKVIVGVGVAADGGAAQAARREMRIKK
jgi:hypothetical protein